MTEVKTRQAMERTMVNMFRVWERNDPAGVKEFIKHVDEIKPSLLREDAFTKQKTMLFYGEIPRRIMDLMCWAFGNHWTDDSEVFSTFWSVFKRFRVNQTSGRPKHSDRPTVKDGYHHQKVDIWKPAIDQLRSRSV